MALLAASPDSKLTLSTATNGENFSNWIPEIESEIDPIKKNRTGRLVPRSEARNVLSSKWNLKIKDASAMTGQPTKIIKPV